MSAPSSDIEKLRLWFRDPVSRLTGDDGFVVLMISMSLFERFVHAKLNFEGKPCDKKDFEAESALILEIDLEAFNKFWGMFRTGLQHFLQPKIFESKGIKYGWGIKSGFPAKPTLIEDGSNAKAVIIDPWEWFKIVFGLWESRPELLSRLSEFPIAEIY